MKNSLNVKTITHLVVFSGTILFVLWVFQGLMYSFFYEKYQIKKIDKLANTIASNYSVNALEVIAFENGVCIEVISGGKNYYFNTLSKGCILQNRNNNETINTYLRKMYNSADKISKIKLINPILNSKSLLYGLRIDSDNYIIINVTLENIDATTTVLQNQFAYIIIIVMTMSIIAALFVSRVITKPILKLTTSAKKLESGDLDVYFESSDITEVDELAQTLNKTTTELKKTDELRRDLMANVSHDLKTPLTMIKAYAEKVRDLSYKDKEKREKDLNVIIDETDRLNILVNDILVLSKMQTKNENLEVKEFDLALVIKEIVNKYIIIKETLNYEFIVDMPGNIMIKADEKKINQVIYNLVNNAINYTGDDNQVIIIVKEDNHGYKVSIKDTGKGIKDEDLPHIWDRYYKNNKHHQRNVIGTGLGLSIVKQILEEHHYKYGVNTKKNKGTEFYFTITK